MREDKRPQNPIIPSPGISGIKNETYRVTGKIDHLHAVLEFIIEQEPIVAQTVLDGNQDLQTNSDLVDEARSQPQQDQGGVYG
ncbi:MAG: hypothetical protein U5O16_25660 [Rhodococcus sp. (in: high G+C Gram-positive bacteria)]|uniref:hypothetical protein n=1 Tax=Rhodococcus sp. TaxID=1831 RepID=UPI002AD9B34D|nr:hypothetical protein [Rhodococcus sp. (in: high G+C Gram-positive bacteria)]